MFEDDRLFTHPEVKRAYDLGRRKGLADAVELCELLKAGEDATVAECIAAIQRALADSPRGLQSQGRGKPKGAQRARK